MNDAARCTVYEYERYDRDTKSFVLAPGMATEQTIKSLGGVVRYSTALEVPAALVDELGHCDRQKRARRGTPR